VLEQKHFDRIAKTIPFLQEPDTRLALDFRRSAFYARFPAGRDIFVEGGRVDGIALLMSGVVRVYKIGETGREITLYRFGEGESCVITANAILNIQHFPAIAVVEQDAEAVMIPADAFIDWVRRHDPWRNFVFQLNAQRLTSVMEVVDEIAFQRMDRRIAAFLLERARSGRRIEITHQAIANELGSSREVVSRLLEDLAGKGFLRLGRGEIDILDAAGLRGSLAW
jgi:CRP/FNR family transcriptional regulator